MLNPHFFLGLPQSFKEKCFIYPPSIEETLRVENYQRYRHLLTISQEELEDDYIQEKEKQRIADSDFNVPTPFEYLLINAYHNKNFERLAQQAFQFFIKQPVTFVYEKKAVLIGDLREKLLQSKTPNLNNLVFIEEEEYFDFQNMIREAIGDKPVEKPNPDEDPRVKRIKAKARYRDKIKAEKGMGVSLGTSLAAICCMNVGLNPLNVGKVSFVALRALTDIYQDKERYQLDIESLLAGADSKKVKPKYWIKNSNEQ